LLAPICTFTGAGDHGYRVLVTHGPGIAFGCEDRFRVILRGFLVTLAQPSEPLYGHAR
jgi:hypothetical protein